MSTQAPLRSVQIPALRRQCLFQRRQYLDRPFPYAASRPFSSTAPRPYKKKSPRLVDRTVVEASTESYVVPSPYAAQVAAQGDIAQMAEDIGLLQHTIIRAPFKNLPRFTSWEFYDYFWKLLKSKGLGFYSYVTWNYCTEAMEEKANTSLQEIELQNNDPEARVEQIPTRRCFQECGIENRSKEDV